MAKAYSTDLVSILLP